MEKNKEKDKESVNNVSTTSQWTVFCLYVLILINTSVVTEFSHGGLYYKHVGSYHKSKCILNFLLLYVEVAIMSTSATTCFTASNI